MTANNLQQTLQHPIPEEVHEDRHKGKNSKDDRESSFLFRVHAWILLQPSSSVMLFAAVLGQVAHL